MQDRWGRGVRCGGQEGADMKFRDMPYQRVDFAQVESRMKELMEAFDRAADGPGQFAVHKQYYELMDQVNSLVTIGNIRFDVDTADAFYSQEHEYYDQQLPVFRNLVLEY